MIQKPWFWTLPVVLIITVVLTADGVAQNVAKEKEFRIERSMPKEAVACIECHKREHPGLFADWTHSRHASANITCYDCHKAEAFDPDVSQEHYKQYQRSDQPYGTREYKIPVAAVVTPKDCSRCHPDEARQYSLSKHANTMEIIWKIDPWLNKGMNSDVERATGCYHCHGTVLKMKNNTLDPETWPNVGVGRINLDKVVAEYNDVYFKPAKEMLDQLYEKGLLDKTKFFDERLEVEYYELWHHEGRRARMGAAMMAPDYAWWHGFYECKKRYNNYMEEARDLIEHNKKAYRATDYPNATGNTSKPKEVFPADQ